TIGERTALSLSAGALALLRHSGRMALMVLLLVTTAMKATAAVGNVLASGSCGTDVTWTLTENGEKAYRKNKAYDGVTLTISGTGAVTSTDYKTVTGLFGSAAQSETFITNVIVGEGVTSLPSQAFQQFYILRRVSLPSTLTTIGNSAFTDCDALKSIVIPDGVTQIPQQAFRACDSLRIVSLGKGVTTISGLAFKDCVRLMTVRLSRYEPSDPNPITSYQSSNSTHPFSGCVSLASIVVPEAGKTRYLEYEDGGETYATVWDYTRFTDADNKTLIFFRDLIRTDRETLFAAGATNEWTEWADKFNHAAPRGAEVYTVGGIDGRTVRLNRITATVTLPEAEREGAGDDGVRALIPAFTPVLIKRSGGTLTEDLKMQFVMGGELTPENGWYGSSGNPSLWSTSGYYDNGAVRKGYVPNVVPDIMASIPYGYTSTYYSITPEAADPSGGLKDNLFGYIQEGHLWGNADKTSQTQGFINALSTDAASYFKLDADQFRFIPNSEAEDGIAPHHCTLRIHADYLGGDLTSPLTLSVNERTGVALADDADNTAAIAAAASTTSNRVTLSGRTLYTDGDWNTLCLPFGVNFGTNTDFFFSFIDNNSQDAIVMELDTEGDYDGHQTGFDADDGTLYLHFRRVYAIEAGKPYLEKWNNRQGYVSNPVFYDTDISTAAPTPVTSADGKVTFTGTYSPVALTPGDKSNLFLGAESTLYYPDAANNADGRYHVGACRAYFTVDITGAAPVRAFVLGFGEDGGTTGIRAIDNGKWTMDNGQMAIDNVSGTWFTLDGLRLSGKPAQRGIYINNGRKIVIK
ncbi:MAG: leucine-rich repeat domain-containing protein, partial [Bacteroidaceae bacterium]|nr:leucine-rich repeat domain-containing protein [Bacteroidaceae bacterium]